MSSSFDQEQRTGTTARTTTSRAQRKACRQTMDPPQDRMLCLRQAIAGQPVRSALIQAKRAAAEMQTPDTQRADRGLCSGWERDRESFAKAVADRYVSTELGIASPRAIRIWCGAPLCEVEYGKVTVMVSFKEIPDHVIARRVRPLGPRCEYTYRCNSQGNLEVTKRKCG